MKRSLSPAGWEDVSCIVISFDLQKEQVIKPQGHLANRHIIHQELSEASCYGHDSQLSALLLALVWLNSWNQNQHNLDCPEKSRRLQACVAPLGPQNF